MAPSQLLSLAPARPAIHPAGVLGSLPHGDPWRDAGVLGWRDPALTAVNTQPLSLREFIADAMPQYGFHRWALVLIALLQQIADGHLSRLIVTCPPRLGKSLLISKLFLAYFVYRHPHLFAAVASYSGELAYTHSREARHFYRATGNPLSRDSAAVGNWLTPQRGGCIAAGVDGPFNGKGYSLGIIDDPYKGPKDAGSALVRSRIVEWLKSVWFLRAEPSFIDAGDGALQRNLSAQIIVLTRWDHEDMVGWLLQQELQEAPQHWHVLDLPAIAEYDADRPQYPPTVTLEPDWRLPGEPLCPERFPLPELLKIRSRTGSFWWSALYQQRPTPAKGGIFQAAWRRGPFQRQRKRRYAPLILSCDLTFKDEADSCYCGFVLMGLLAPDPGQRQKLEIEVLWAVRKKLGLPGTLHFLMAASAALQQQGLRPDAVLVEDAANGPAVLQMLKRKIRGLLPIPPRGSKEQRAHAAAPLMEAQQVGFHPRADPLLEELPRFPKGTKDLTDAFCHGALWLEDRYWKGLGVQQAPVPLLLSR